MFVNITTSPAIKAECCPANELYLNVSVNMKTLSSIILTACLTFVSGHPLLRSLRHVHDLTPVDECNEIVGPVRCGIDSIGYQDSDVVCCNGTKCSPPVTHTSQESDCPKCVNGGTPVGSNECMCPPGFNGTFCQLQTGR